MMRNRTRIAALLGGLGALAFLGLVAIVAGASPASAADETPACAADSLSGVVFAIDGAAPTTDLASLGPLTSGATITMAWDGVAPGCEDQLATLAAHRVDGSPTAEVTEADACILAECGGSISFTVPARAVVCRGELVAAVGPPQLDRFFYGTGEIAAATIDDGDCAAAAPAASVVVLCGLDTRVGVSLTNTGEVDAVLTVRLAGDTNAEDRIFEVGSLERFQVFEVAEDTLVSVTVFDGDDIVIQRDLRPDCFAPPAAPIISPDCAMGGASVVLDNPTPTPLGYVIMIDGVSTRVTVAAFGVERVAVPIVENTSREIVVHDAASAELARAVVPRDCERPRAVVSLECVSRSVVFTLTNDGSLRSMVDLLIDGKVVVSIPVEAGGRTVARLDLAEDQTAVVGAASSGVELVRRRLTLDCQPPPPQPPPPVPAPLPTVTPEPAPPAGVTQVLGVSFTRTGGATLEGGTATMPATGFDSFGLLQLATLLVLIGGAFVTLSAFVRRRTTRYVVGLKR